MRTGGMHLRPSLPIGASHIVSKRGGGLADAELERAAEIFCEASRAKYLFTGFCERRRFRSLLGFVVEVGFFNLSGLSVSLVTLVQFGLAVCLPLGSA